MQGVHRSTQRDCAAVLRGACSTPACHHDCASPDKACWSRMLARLLRQAKKATDGKFRPGRFALHGLTAPCGSSAGRRLSAPSSFSPGRRCREAPDGGASEARNPKRSVRLPTPLTTGLPGSPTQRSFPSGCSGNSMWRPLLPEPARDAGGPGRKTTSARSRAASGAQSRTRLAPKMNRFHRPGLNTRRDFSTRDELHGRLRLGPIRFLHRLRPRLQRYSPPELMPKKHERSQSLNGDQGVASLGTGRERWTSRP